ncbi:MAG: hypothetical protein OJF58_000896 [Enhydrobacter sp.]|jgi:hypothetical protein|nr:MAG: hypothetical protein OJF58_000896 [Enhydrobacter sp.]
MIDPIGGWRVLEAEAVVHNSSGIVRRRTRERDILTFIGLVALTLVLLPGAVATALLL